MVGTETNGGDGEVGDGCFVRRREIGKTDLILDSK